MLAARLSLPHETHGRWPIVGAIALGPVAAAAVKRPALRPLAAVMAHQTEEWVWPGEFLPWMNREILGSDEDEFPIDRRIGFGLNVVYGWGFSLVGALGRRGAAPAALLYITHLGNAGLHISWAVRNRRYDPGTVTSALTLAPAALAGLHGLITDPEVPRRSVARGVAGGLIMSAALAPVLKWRVRRRRALRLAG